MTIRKLQCWQRLIIVAVVALASCHAAPRSSPPAASEKSPRELIVSAAASLKDALGRIGSDYEAHSRVKIHFNFASSGTLQRQIEQGAPVDLFVSAAEKNMDELAARNLIDRGTRHVLVSNRLVLIVPAGRAANRVHGFRDLANPAVRQIAIGEPRAVPAGKYAREVLRRLGIWPRVAPKAVQCKDVRQVLTQVELGNVDAGIVYVSDAAISNRVRTVATAPEALHSPIRYPVAMVARSRQTNAARQFEAYLLSPQAAAVFRQYRFSLPSRR